MSAKATVKYVRVPPRKARLVADMIRGKNTNEAVSILTYTPKKGAGVIRKLLKSAISNAAADGKMDIDTLFVSKICVDEGPIYKRYMPRAQGRATPKFHRSSHIQLELAEK